MTCFARSRWLAEASSYAVRTHSRDQSLFTSGNGRRTEIIQRWVDAHMRKREAVVLRISSPLLGQALAFRRLAQCARNMEFLHEQLASSGADGPWNRHIGTGLTLRRLFGFLANEPQGNDLAVHGSSPRLGFGRLRTCLHAEHIPSNIGAQVLAADCTAGQALYRRAMLRRHAAALVLPLTHGGLRNAERSSECSLRTDNLCGAVDGVVHA